MVQSSNPKQKYHQQRDKDGKNAPLLVDNQHKQKAPLLVTMDRPQLQPLNELPTSDQIQVSESCGNDKEDGHIEENVPTVGDDGEDIETELVDGTSTSEGDQFLQRHIKTEETDLLMSTGEGKLEDGHPSRSPPEAEQAQEATTQVCLLILTLYLRNNYIPV